jgi:hypothetical protein
MRQVVIESAVQLCPLGLRGVWDRIAASDVVPQRLYQLDLFLYAELAGLIEKLSIHGQGVSHAEFTVAR